MKIWKRTTVKKGRRRGGSVADFFTLRILAAAAIFFAAPIADLSAAPRAEAKPKAGYWALSGRKLARGLQNVGTGSLKLPAGIHNAGEPHGVGAAATIGLLDGLGKAISRTAIGVFEVVTFPIGVPQNFEPLIDPEIGRRENR